MRSFKKANCLRHKNANQKILYLRICNFNPLHRKRGFDDVAILWPPFRRSAILWGNALSIICVTLHLASLTFGVYLYIMCFKFEQYGRIFVFSIYVDFII